MKPLNTGWVHPINEAVRTAGPVRLFSDMFISDGHHLVPPDQGERDSAPVLHDARQLRFSKRKT